MLAGVDHRPRARDGDRLHALFEQRCDALLATGQGQHAAIVTPEITLGYAGLDALANQLARHLHAQGVRPGDVLGLLFDKGVWAIAAMLAVGKLEAVYVPLDASFPSDRLAFIADDSGMGWMLSEQRHAERAAGAARPVLCLDTQADEVAAQPTHRLAPSELGAGARQDADARCYTIYTSGSTGRPKGVPIDHAQVVNFVRVAVETYGYRQDDRVYQGLTLAFDFAVEEIWVPLAVGATLVPNQSGGSLLGADLAEFLVRHRITALCCVPTLLATLDEDLPALRLLIVSGEACPRDLVQRWHRPGRRFLNAYGPTEATVTATIGQPVPGQAVTIGRPLPTYAIVILPPGECRALPMGDEGEIGIAGIGIAGGYLNRDEQTRAAFVRDEIGVPHNTSGRIYRTGDLGRINADGEVEYLGRIDTQVKIRGYRIELAEIESLLLNCPGVLQAVVQPWETSPGVMELVAYYTGAPGSACDGPSAEQLADVLRAHLPSYMLPSHYERLDQMPMLASDKADRKRLPPPSGPRLDNAQLAFEAPVEGLEQMLAKQVEGLLGLPRVSATAHFFHDLGMSSLLLARLSARLRNSAGLCGALAGVSMRQLYGHPTVRQLALALHSLSADAGGAVNVDGPGLSDSTASMAPGAVAAPYAAQPKAEWPPHRASQRAYVACGAVQLLLGMAFVGAHAAAWWWACHWTIDAPHWPAALGRGLGSAALYLATASLLPVVAKWLLVGRVQASRLPVWSLAYLRFWAVRMLIRSSPVVALAGSPVYNLYLRSLGARIHPRAFVGLAVPPACPDMLSVGAEAVLGLHSVAAGYRVRQGWVEIGPVQVGVGAQVGEFAVLDIHTSLGTQAELAHVSSLQAGQQVPAGERWHGSPAVPAGRAPGPRHDAELPEVSAWRRWRYSAVLLATMVLVTASPLLGAHALWGESGHALDSAGTTVSAWTQQLAAWLDNGPARIDMVMLGWAAAAVAAYLGWLVCGLLWVSSVPRWCARALRPGQVFPLYGWRHWLLGLVRSSSNVPMFNSLFGDSADIVRYLKAIGWRMPGLRQTGSNFGMAQQHDVPVLCSVGSGTLVSDGLSMLNAEMGARGVRLHDLALGQSCFLGNAVAVPPGHRVGDNCLLASKVMLPTDGPLREGVGLLGSPAFEIPRRSFDPAARSATPPPDWVAERLSGKIRSNRWSMVAYLAANAVPVVLVGACWPLLYPLGQAHGAWFAAGMANLALALTLVWMVVVDAASRGFKPLQPMRSALLEPEFWRHERHWKLGLANDNPLLAALAGTPLRAVLWRAMGVKVGRRLMDDGASITEKTLVQLGHDCTLGERAILQGHSLEDGHFQSDRLFLADGVSVGGHCYVHYGVHLGTDSTVMPDAFVMKGQQVPARECWVGNPAQRR